MLVLLCQAWILKQDPRKGQVKKTLSKDICRHVIVASIESTLIDLSFA